MYVDLKKAQIYKAVLFEKTFSPRLLGFLKNLFLSFGSIAGALYCLLLLSKNIPLPTLWLHPSFLLSLLLTLLPLGLSMLFVQIFYEFYLKEPRRIKDEENLAEFLHYDAAYVLNLAISISNRRGEKEVSTDSLLLALLHYKLADTIFRKVDIEPRELKKVLSKTHAFAWANPRRFVPFQKQALSQDLMNLLLDANKIRIDERSAKINMTDLIVSLFDFNPMFKELIIAQDLDKKDLHTISTWHTENKNNAENRKRFWRLENLTKTSPFGISWTYGYPHLLAQFTRTIDVRRRSVKEEIAFVNREKELERVGEILSQSGQANVLLVGEEKVGKESIVIKLAERIAEGKSFAQLNYKRILELDTGSIASSSKYSTDVINVLNRVLFEATSIGNIILYIPGIHTFIGEVKGLGQVDVSSVIAPFLASTNLQIIATTDLVNFHRLTLTHSHILGAFIKVEVDELSKKDVFKVIANLALILEASQRIFLSYGALKAIIEDADKYIRLVFFPGKAIALLYETAAFVNARQEKVVKVQHVHDVVTQKTGIPLGIIGLEERKKLINLDLEMHKEIVGQDEAITVVTQAMQRLRSGISREGKPAGVFLFVGPTGVGKTLTAKVFAKHYFGSENQMIRFDMSEFQNKESLDQLIGSVELNDPGRLTVAVSEKPFSVLLLDEFEKAHREILNIFLQVFDEGWVSDAFGRKVNFEQNIIIATSNAGAGYIREMIKESIDPSRQKERIIDIFVQEKYFQPELLNRFDEIVVFHPMAKDHAKKIAEILIGKLTLRLKEVGYYYKPTQEIINYIADIGFDPQFGARSMHRVIQDKLETVIAQKILTGSIKKGQEFELPIEEVK